MNTKMDQFVNLAKSYLPLEKVHDSRHIEEPEGCLEVEKWLECHRIDVLVAINENWIQETE